MPAFTLTQLAVNPDKPHIVIRRTEVDCGATLQLDYGSLSLRRFGLGVTLALRWNRPGAQFVYHSVGALITSLRIDLIDECNSVPVELIAVYNHLCSVDARIVVPAISVSHNRQSTVPLSGRSEPFEVIMNRL